MTFLDQIQNLDHMLIADGATGTQLQKAGLTPGTPPELWNLDNPQAIINLHKSYLEAGSTIILTNTFGGNPIKLKMANLADRCVEINLAAARLAREAAGPDRFVMGDVGPTGKLLQPLGPLSLEEVEEAYFVQMKALVDGGVDGIWIETMSDLEEAKAAIRAARRFTDLPLMVSFSFDSHGRTMMGLKPGIAAREIWALGVTAVGVNCGRTLSESLVAIQEMKQSVPDARLIAKPNAGLPRLDSNQSVYDVTPEIMAEYAQKFQAEGVIIFGGCCGSNPDHIRAAANAVSSV